MAALTRPDLPPGPRRELLDALHDLHHGAGWPSLRALAAAAGCSPTTVSAAFSSPRLPSWGLLELLVEAMDGDTAEFHRLWLAASTPRGAAAPAARIAGRHDELAVVRHHLESGTGLLLVTGEAGIGKTTLVETASGLTDTFVARGAGLPLSGAVPLLPIATALRDVYDTDPDWLEDALSTSPRYVRPTLATLLPELGEDGPAGDPAWARHRLFAAVATALVALADARPFAVCLDDVHWADVGTLELLEHLLARGIQVPFVGTYRLDDPDLPEPVSDWFPRVRRSKAVVTVSLAPLTAAETAEQLRLLGADAAESMPAIYARSRGHPLFTEQLAAHAADEQPLPSLLVDVLDRRLDHLHSDARRVVRALAIADRPLDDGVLHQVTRLSPDELPRALHQLDQRRLLASPDDRREVELRHPLLAEAVRRRLLVGEARDVHRRLAEAFADQPEAEPAEIAAHWQLAGEPAQELVWRLRAADIATERFTPVLEWGHWQRAIALWPTDASEAGDPMVSLCWVLLTAVDAAEECGAVEEGGRLIRRAMGLTGLTARERADVLSRAGWYESHTGDPVIAVAHLDEAIAIYEASDPGVALVDALNRRAEALLGLGRIHEGDASIRRAVELSVALDDPARHRQSIAHLAWYEAVRGNAEVALDLVRDAGMPSGAEGDPYLAIDVASLHAALLLRGSGSWQEVEAAARPGLDAAAEWSLEGLAVSLLRAQPAEAYLRAGEVGRAAALVDPVTTGPPTFATWADHVARAALDVCRGRPAHAHDRLRAVRGFGISPFLWRLRLAEVEATCAVWDGAPDRALRELVTLLREAQGMEWYGHVGRQLLLAARAAADLAAHGDDDPRRRRVGERIVALRTGPAADPFGPHLPADARAALSATWTAETGRLAGVQAVDTWSYAASAWDRIAYRFDAAYCRWRGAQAALATGRGTMARRLLSRAAVDAHGHVPLDDAIRATRAWSR